MYPIKREQLKQSKTILVMGIHVVQLFCSTIFLSKNRLFKKKRFFEKELKETTINMFSVACHRPARDFKN